MSFTNDQMSVTLADGRMVGVPLRWFPTLLAATPEQRADVRIGGGGVGLHWPELDEDVSVAGLLTGVTPDANPLPNHVRVVGTRQPVAQTLEHTDGSASGSVVSPLDVLEAVPGRPGQLRLKTKPGKRAPTNAPSTHSLSAAQPGEGVAPDLPPPAAAG